MSSKQKKAKRIEPAPARRLWPVVVFSAVALAIAAYLAWISLTGRAAVGCGPNSDCRELLATQWAYWFGLPVSAMAIGLYASFLVLLLGLARGKPFFNPAGTRKLALLVAFTMIYAALWFVALQVFILKRFCPYCLAAHAFAVLAAVLFLSVKPVGQAQTKIHAKSNRPQTPRREAALGAVGLLVLLIVGQMLYHPKTYTVKTLASGGLIEPPRKSGRTYGLYGGKFQLNLDDEPMIGEASASNVIVGLFDYTCPHCRDMHGYLAQAQQVFSNQLAIVNLVMPLDGACNRFIKHTAAMHEDACELARIGLAVWRVNRNAARGFDDWIFSSVSPPTATEARRRAAELIGKELFDQNVREAWIDNEIQRNVAIFGAGYIQDKRGLMPQLIVGRQFVAGPFNRVSDFYGLLALEFGLKKAE